MSIHHFKALLVGIFVIPALVAANLTFAGFAVNPRFFATIVCGSVFGWAIATLEDLRCRRREGAP